MQFELEYELASQRLKKIIRWYGSNILENPSRCHAFWGDLAPDLPEEGKALDKFLAAGLGDSVVELDEEEVASCMKWKQHAVEILFKRGMEQKEAVSLVEMVLQALGLGVEEMPQSAVETEAPPKLVNTLNQGPLKKQVGGNNLEKTCQLLAYYLPKIFLVNNYVYPEVIPSDIMENITEKLGRERLDYLNILAYGSSLCEFYLFTEEELIIRPLNKVGDNYEFVYNKIKKLTVENDDLCVWYESASGVEKVEICVSIIPALADLLSALAGIEKAEVYVDDTSKIIGNRLREYKIDSSNFYDKRSGIPERKLGNVYNSLTLAKMHVSKEEIEAIILDETLLGVCKGYIAFTSTGIYGKYGDGAVNHVKYLEIESMNEGKGNVIVISRRDGMKNYLYYRGNKLQLMNAISEIQTDIEIYSDILAWKY